ncbi:Type I Iterative PKS [Lepraria neglecta]|uniref:Type I Iterative PKS n=1 Tax=Lepraria neglecta TaxID=209136 RepID=A0AAD9YZ63_9LECA|nr:Type I Iterative PKS [Lepraria neglecta]
MPFIRDSSTPSSSDVEYDSNGAFGAQQVTGDISYAGASLPGYSEKPLSEQLEPIAVVGMGNNKPPGCRLPGDVKSPSEFWNMMINKGSGQMPRVPDSRLKIDAHYHSNNDRPGSFGVLGGYFLKETLQEFDPTFFGITPIEAMWMDPQQRKLLEVVYETFGSAGATLQEISGSSTACFVASFTADFQQMAFKEPSFRHSLAATGVDPGIISSRISHVFNLNGPSIVVNTACSSSVYAMHNACNALRNKECSAAVVGGVNLVLTVDQHMNTAKLGVLSPTSTCHTFDASADGYGRAEGVGAVYLKRLSDAVRDGDPIRGLIRSSATNSNGKVPAVGITHPNLDSQANVIKKAYERGGLLDPRLTGYFECHGTGTAVGDPLEVHAVANAMNENRQSQDGPLFVGVVKTNIGHSEAASDLSAFIKAILTVERGIIPPTKGVQVPVEPTPFPSHLPVKRVSVNSFGYGDTNAHIVVESADSFLLQPQTYTYNASPRRLKAKSPRGAFNHNRPYLLPFSAHDKQSLKRNIEAYGGIADSYNLLDLSYALANRRTHFPSRGIVVASHANINNVFKDNLKEFVFAEKKRTPTVGFLFTGQGAQWPRMGAELMTYYPSFLRSIRYLDMALGDLEDSPDWTLEDALLEDPKSSRVNEAEFSQSLCTAIQVALVQLLGLWGIRLKVTCGHSSGEIAAAFAAGLISASEAIILAYYRGKVVRDINTNGAMLAVGLGVEAIKPYLKEAKDEVVVACHNSPAGVTLSGNADLLETLKKDLIADNVFARSVNTNGKAYHSHHMHSAAAKYEALVGRARLNMPLDLPLSVDAKMVSTVTNSILSKETVLDEAYWSANLLNPVLFNQAVQTIATAPEFAEVDMLIEVGPHSALSGPIRQIKAEYKFDNIKYLPTLIRAVNSASSLLTLVGELFLRNFPLDMERLTALEESSGSGKISCEKDCLIVDLPSYRWDKGKKFWAEARQSREHRAPKFPRHDLLGSMTLGGSLAEPTWRNVLRIRDLPWLQDHFLGGEAVFPAAGYFSMAMEAITQANELQSPPATVEGYVLRDISIKNALVTPDDDAGVEVLLTMRPSLHGEGDAESAWWDFNVSSMSDTGHPNDHMAGSISINTRPQRPSVRTIPNLSQRASGKAWNKALKDVGFDYSPTFKDMDDISMGRLASDGEVLMEISDMRCFLHEAAVPQRASEPSSPRPYGEMVWELDVDSIGSSQQLDIPLCIKLAEFKNPGTRVLEIGSEHTEALLDKIPDLHFTVTEKTAEATELLAQKLGVCKNAKAQTVDLTLDLTSQPIKESSFDLVIASISSSNDLLSIRKLLTAGGRAVLELSEPTLIESLEGADFVQTGLELNATMGKHVIIANAVDAASKVMTNGVSHKILLVYRQKPPAVLSHVRDAFESFGYEVLTSKLQDPIPAVKDIVMLADFESPLLSTITETEFIILQRITSDAHSIMWASAGGLSTGRIAEQAMASGFLRSLTSEQALQQIEKAVSTENEYCGSEGQIYISRLVSNDTINEMYTLDETDIRKNTFDPE